VGKRACQQFHLLQLESPRRHFDESILPLTQVMMVKKMQESDTENEIREAYRVFDKERSGGIAASEMRLILSNLPEKLSPEEIEEMLEAADRDGNGVFSYDEFRMMIGSTMSTKQM